MPAGSALQHPGEALARARVPLAAAALAASIGPLAVVSPPIALGVVVAAAFAVAAVTSLAAGVALFTVLAFFELIPGAGSGLTLVKAAGVVLAAAWLTALAARRTRALLTRDHPVLAYAAIVLAGLAFASSLWAEDGGTARFGAYRLAQGILLLFIVYSAVTEPRHVRWLVWAYVAGALLTAVVGLGGATGPDTTGPGATADSSRLAGGIGDPNQLAAILVPALVLAAFGLAAFRGGLARWLLLAAAAVFAVALFMTESRGGLVALGAVLAIGLVLAGPVRRPAVAVVLAVAGIGIAYYTLAAPPEAVARVTDFAADGGTGRTDLWSVAVDVVDDHPVLGVGMANFPVVEPAYAAETINLPNVRFILDTPKVAHNTYLEVLAELGIVGLAAFAATVVGALALGLRAVRAFARLGELELELLGRGLVIGTLGMLAAFLFVSAEYEKQLWLLTGALAALPSLIRSKEVAMGQSETASTQTTSRATRLFPRRSGSKPADPLESLAERIAGQRDGLKAARRRHERERRELDEWARRLEETESRVTSARADLERLDQAGGLHAGDLRDLARAVAERDRAIQELRRRIEGQLDPSPEREAVVRAKAEIASRELELAAAKDELRERLRRIGELEQELQAETDRAEKLERFVADSEQQLATAQEPLAERERLLRQRLGELRAEREQLERLTAEADELRGRASALEREREGAVTRLAELRATAEDGDRELVAQRRHLAERRQRLEQQSASIESAEARLAQLEELIATERRERKERAAALSEEVEQLGDAGDPDPS